ncbi:hypothetical protein QQS21_007510 [Conoideocrella luteorostrata]|uniref:Ankyrin n=1 Tax=Conoideocrella luteorostrata TaxID=1105319 RepID=A0AAJ0FXB0_9HYPO|nr:hypothetical protein QQS21_007510 [Conoideocrella luteorostrata]
MATSTDRILSTALGEAIKSIGSTSYLAQIKTPQEDSLLKEQFLHLQQELASIYRIFLSLQSLAQRYENQGQAVPNAAPYVVLQRCPYIFGSVQNAIKKSNAEALLEGSSLLKPVLLIAYLACDWTDSLAGVHNGLVPSVGSYDEAQAINLSVDFQHTSLEKLYNLNSGDDVFPAYDTFQTALHLEPDRATFLEWMEVLNCSKQDRAPVDFNKERCLVDVRYRRNPIYAVASMRWPEYAKSNWLDIKEPAQRLFSHPASNNFIQWALEYARMRFPDHFEFGHNDDAVSRLLALTDELECRTLTPLHFSAMFGLSDLCRFVLLKGADVNIAGRFGSPLYCALVGRQVLVQKAEAPSWEALRTAMNPADSVIVRDLVERGASCKLRFNLTDDISGVTFPSLAFAASIKVGDFDIFDIIIRAAGRLGPDFESMIRGYCFRSFNQELQKLISKLVTRALDYHLALREGEFPWDKKDNIGSVLTRLLFWNKLTLDQSMGTELPLIQNDSFDRAVRECIINGHFIYFKRFMIDPRFNPNLAADKYGTYEDGTIVHLAVGARQYRMLTCFDPVQTDFTAVDCLGRTPLMVAEDPAALHVLVCEFKVSTTTVDHDGRNIWHYAAATNDCMIMDWLCKYDPSARENINVVTKIGRSPLIEALLYVDTFCREHQTPPKPRVAYMLLQVPFIDCSAGSADLPISQLAMRWGDPDLVNMLANAGVDFGTSDNDDRCALSHLGPL